MTLLLVKLFNFFINSDTDANLESMSAMIFLTFKQTFRLIRLRTGLVTHQQC